jgi:hypothetical protein
MRMASEARRVRLIAGLAACCCFAFACAKGTSDVTATWTLEPPQPSTDAATVVRVALARQDGSPVTGATLRLEAHMSHPGMAPVVGELTERGGGIYESRVTLTMAGPWVVVVSGDLPGGGRILKQTEVTAVQPSR